MGLIRAGNTGNENQGAVKTKEKTTTPAYMYASTLALRMERTQTPVLSPSSLSQVAAVGQKSDDVDVNN